MVSIILQKGAGEKYSPARWSQKIRIQYHSTSDIDIAGPDITPPNFTKEVLAATRPRYWHFALI
jgi:hypothetical protein